MNIDVASCKVGEAILIRALVVGDGVPGCFTDACTAELPIGCDCGVRSSSREELLLGPGLYVEMVKNRSLHLCRGQAGSSTDDGDHE